MVELVGVNEQSFYKIGVYVRESRDDNEENYETLETQRDLLLNYAAKNHLGEVHGVYLDDNVSGSAFERPGLAALKGDVRAKKIDLLLLKDLSRLGRNNVKTLGFLDFLEEHAVRVLTFDGRYDSLRDSDTVGIDTWYNERFVRDISKKIRTNLRFKIEKGEYIGHAPFGYEKSHVEKNRLVIEQDEAGIVKEIYRLYRQGYGYGTIAKRLNEKNLITPSSGKGPGLQNCKWNHTAVQRILSNRVYIGDTVQGISEKISFKSKKTRRLPKEQWVVSRNTHEPIVDMGDFDEVQKIRESKGVKGQHKGEIHLFKGLLWCGGCGSVLIARKRASRPMGYVCSKYGMYGKNRCSSHQIQENVLKKIVAEEIFQLLQNEGVKSRLLGILKNRPMGNGNGTKDILRLEQILAGKQRQQDILYNDRLEGKISDQLFDRTNTHMENKMVQLRRDIEKLHSRSDCENDPGKLVNQLSELIRNEDFSNEFLREVVDKIVVISREDENSEEFACKSAILIFFKFEFPQ